MATSIQTDSSKAHAVETTTNRRFNGGSAPWVYVVEIVSKFLPHLNGDRARRILNVTSALVLLVLTAPLMLLIASLIKLTSRGPILYVQGRIGLDRRQSLDNTRNCRREYDHGGMPFEMLKFRTMRVDQGTNPKQVWTLPDDPRITPVGRALRKYRLDELPQLINVLKGEMNLVGPRPEQPGIFASLRDEIDGYHERQRVLPGITGLAQISRAYDRSLDDVKGKLSLDLEYIDRRSALADLRIMAKTLPVMIFRRGAW